MTLVTIGETQFSGGEGNNGFYLDGDGFTGWYDGVDSRLDTPERPLAPGAFDAPGYAGSRLVELSGLCLASSVEELQHYGRTLTGLLGAGERGRMTVQDDLTLWADVRRLGKPEFRSVVWGKIARYSLQLLAVDPRKYGGVNVFTRPAYTTFASYHYGNTTASPVYTVSGFMADGYEIQGPAGRRFRVTERLVPEQPHTVDMLTGLLRIGGNVATTGGIVFADTWRIAAGQQIAQRVAPIGGVGYGDLTATVTDTYI